MQDLQFASAACAPPPRILRVQMLPYSIGHELRLEHERNPLLCSAEHFDSLPLHERVKAIIRAVSICSRTWQENRRPDRWLRLWLWLVRDADFKKAAASFRQYRIEGSSFPELYDAPQAGDQSRFLGAPFLCRVLAEVRDMDFSLGVAQWIYFTNLEWRGGCQIANEQELQIKSEIARLVADYDREQEEKREKEKDAPCQH